MLFNSFEFLIFLPVVFILYWFVFARNLKLQNLFVVVVSYLFYGWWDWHFLLLIAFTTFCSFLSGIFISPNGGWRSKGVLAANIIINLTILGFFKYFNFFVESFVEAFSLFDSNINFSPLKIILPVGISFYTFQALSYSIDVYRGKITPTRDVVAFFAFVSFFPQLVAGPIERATNLLPQFERRRVFDADTAISGFWLVIWGFFMKLCVADRLGLYVDAVYSNLSQHNSASILLASVFFTFQIYCDFAGYSNIAIGVARWFGISLMQNFNYPYLSRNIAEFWRKWHISLTTWFRDYLYIPLGGSRGGKWCSVRNTFVIFLMSGLWHGANWTFVLWGAFHAVLFVPLLLSGKNRKYIGDDERVFSLREVVAVVATFMLAVVGWMFFRANSVADIALIFSNIFMVHGALFLPESTVMTLGVLSLGMLIVKEWLCVYKGFDILRMKPVAQVAVAAALIAYILLCGVLDNSQFIYFQF